MRVTRALYLVSDVYCTLYIGMMLQKWWNFWTTWRWRHRTRKTSFSSLSRLICSLSHPKWLQSTWYLCFLLHWPWPNPWLAGTGEWDYDSMGDWEHDCMGDEIEVFCVQEFVATPTHACLIVLSETGDLWPYIHLPSFGWRIVQVRMRSAFSSSHVVIISPFPYCHSPDPTSSHCSWTWWRVMSIMSGWFSWSTWPALLTSAPSKSSLTVCSLRYIYYINITDLHFNLVILNVATLNLVILLRNCLEEILASC